MLVPDCVFVMTMSFLLWVYRVLAPFNHSTVNTFETVERLQQDFKSGSGGGSMKPATAPRELTQLDSLRAQIRVSETWQGRSVTDAEARSQAMFNCPIDSLTTEQAYEVLKA